MRLELTCHPDTPCEAIQGVEVDVTRADRTLTLRYIAIGRVTRLALPAPARSEMVFADLWKHTCFEMFMMLRSGGYLELNLSPSTQWAAYEFEGYRLHKSTARIDDPQIGAFRKRDRFELEAILPNLGLSNARLALSAVIEETNGAKSYWALRHPPGKPDFHHADSFAYELAP
jgi:hypothetical protein